ncbi:hypothetical protein ACHAXT_007360 [Thalassiosira profunda]
MAIPLLALSSLCLGGGEAAAFVAVERTPPSRPMHLPLRRTNCNYPSYRPRPTLPLCATTSRSASAEQYDSGTTRAMALQLMAENAMPQLDMDDPLHGDISHPLGHYDDDHQTPLESEFVNMMNAFLTYSERDIQSLTTTSNRYLHYPQAENEKKPKLPHQRSKEEGIRYRVLYAGVQAASLEPEVLRSFTVLFEDYLPIRLAGRRIFKHLRNVMEEVREERRGEIVRAAELCPRWDQGFVECARDVWDTVMDEGLLLEHSLDSVLDEEQSQEGGVLSLHQLMDLGIDKSLIEEGLVDSMEELENIVRQSALEEELQVEEYYNSKRRKHHPQDVQDGQYLEMTFAVFMKVLYQCSTRKQSYSGEEIRSLLQSLEENTLEHRTHSAKEQETSILLAEKAIHSGSSTSCKKREKFSDRFDEYVSTFKLWEGRFLGNSKGDELEMHPTRRVEILKGCFFGARNPQVVAALRIVYLDYRPLRLAGDLIFKLMSTVQRGLAGS